MELFSRNSRDIEKIVDDDGIERLVAYSPLHAGQEGLFLALTIDNSVSLHQIRKDRNCALLLLLSLAAATAIAMIWMGDAMSVSPRPKLADAAVRLRAGDLTARAARLFRSRRVRGPGG